jgi:hypothetical protein
LKQPMNLTKDRINNITAQMPTGMAISIYIPTHFDAAPQAMNEDQIRTRNLFGEAIRLLEQYPITEPLQTMLREQIDEMIDDATFWKNLSRGLLVIGDNTRIEMFYLPIDTEEYVAVSDCYHLAPIFGLLQEAKEYYVLSLAQHNPMLLKGTMYGLEPSGIMLPQTIETGLNIDENNQKSEQQRSSGATGNFNGRGGAKNPQEDDRHQFWRMIDGIICQHADKHLPLILAGTEKDLSEYRSKSHYPIILNGMMHGNFSDSSSRELLPQALTIINGELIETMHDKALSSYERIQGTMPDHVATKLPAIQDAAETGRVESLLISVTRRTADSVRDSAEQVTMLTFQASQKINQAVQMAAMAVWKAGGQIINVDQSRMPRRGTLALATLRY